MLLLIIVEFDEIERTNERRLFRLNLSDYRIFLCCIHKLVVFWQIHYFNVNNVLSYLSKSHEKRLTKVYILPEISLRKLNRNNVHTLKKNTVPLVTLSYL